MAKTSEIETPIPADFSEAPELEHQLKGMSKKELIKYIGDMGYNADEHLSEKTLRENIMRIVNDKKINAQKTNKESLKKTVSDDDPAIRIRFFNLESPGIDLEFAYAGPKGMFGENNPNGHKKCPTYHLFPGEVTELAYSVYEHLSSLTFVTHKPVWDPVTGMISGNIPIIKPRFILQPVLSKEQLINLSR